ncbi:MAG: ABC transporter substrate-binding protein [Nocardioidaceae bacterium]
MRFKKPMISLVAASMLALAACGGSGTGGDKTSGAPTVDTKNLGNTGDGTDPTRQGPVTIQGAKKGGTVKVISYAGLNTMDPTEAYYTNTSSILSGLVTRSLTQYVYDPTKKQMILVPDLATDLGKPNSDFTKWSFTIRKGVKYENGDPVTPQDIKYGIERSFDRSTFPEGANYSNLYFQDGDKYKGPYKSGDNYKGVTIKGQTLTIQMAKPFPDMPYWGAFPAMGPIPKGKDDPAKYRQHPLATGPYMFQQYTPEKTLTLVRNPNWDPKTDPGRTAYPDKYEFNFQTPSAKVDQIMLNDTGDAANTLSYDNVLAPDFRQFSTQDKDRLILGGQPCTFYWAPDYRKVTDINVRKALAWAYPYRDAALAAGYIDGVTRVFDQGGNLMPPGVPGRTTYNPLPGHQGGSTDAAKAKALLKQSGNMNYPIKWLFATDDPNSVKAKNVVASALKAAGFDPQPVASTVADISTVREDPNAKINVRSAGWCSDWPSGGSWFPPVIQSTNLKAEGLGSNYPVFSEPSVDKKINDVQTKPVAQQPAAWDQLDRYVMKKYFPLFITGYGGVAMMRGSNIQGMNDDAVFGMPTWKDIWVG